MTLGELIKLNRKQKNMTQPELAEAAQIEQSYLSKLENDKCSPSFEVIQKVATALDQDAMRIINKLSPTYISQNLAHLPEVAAEFSEIKKRQQNRLKRRFIMAAMVVTVGIGIFMVGQLSLLFPEEIYTYVSDGVVFKDEPVMKFSQYRMNELGESADDQRARLHENTKRFDRKYLQLNKKQSSEILKEVPKGRRLYEFHSSNTSPDTRNSYVAIFGMMVIVAGCFGFWYAFKFKD